MKNSKIIVLNGFRHGGTTIVWNILQSHPKVCSPIHETGSLLYRRVFRRAPRLARKMLTNPLIFGSPIGYPLRCYIDSALFSWKMKNYSDDGNRTKYDGVPYTLDELETTVLCLKSVDRDVDLTDYFASFYKQSYFFWTDPQWVCTMRKLDQKEAHAGSTGR